LRRRGIQLPKTSSLNVESGTGEREAGEEVDSAAVVAGGSVQRPFPLKRGACVSRLIQQAVVRPTLA
jgi:hypothetical protein